MRNHPFHFFVLVAQSSALSIDFTVREHNHMSASVIKGIVVGIIVLVAIPLLWCAYKMCNSARRTTPFAPIYVMPPPMFPNATQNNNHASNTPTLGHITRPYKAHTKVNAPTSRR